MLDICSNLCHTINMTYTRDQLITALVAEHQQLTHDDYDTNTMNDAQYRSFLQSLSVEQLIDETECDETLTLDEYMSTYYS